MLIAFQIYTDILLSRTVIVKNIWTCYACQFVWKEKKSDFRE